jgi:threonine/homoserine/homoserine lactone efflux protein
VRAAAVAGFLAAIFPLIATPGASFTLLLREVTPPGRGRAAPVILATAQATLVAAWLAGWTLLLGGAARLTRSPRAGLLTNRISACALVGLGIRGAVT